MDRWPLTEQSLARTYRSSYDDAYEAILDYRRVQSYQESHPDAGSYKVANALELPRGRIRGWMDETTPDALSGVRRAQKLGWFDVDSNDPADPLLRAFIQLLAGVYAGGSIRSSGWMPHWTINGPINRIKQSLDTLGMEYRQIHIQDAQRATELVPRTDGSLLARSLSVLGAPTQSKNKSSIDSLPAYLFELPLEIRREFAGVYVAYRQSGDSQTISLQENRADSYHRNLAKLITSVIDDPDSVTVGERGIYISADVRDSLFL
ncbi:hypothetical protein [Haloplanus natans]|uniref:hypothetical protein n=1 Tax=Haloplanus natans TaxID=376171 RepID=UPI0012F859A0|nr:hypothetical protein [Haloplanus natans]